MNICFHARGRTHISLVGETFSELQESESKRAGYINATRASRVRREGYRSEAIVPRVRSDCLHLSLRAVVSGIRVVSWESRERSFTKKLK